MTGTGYYSDDYIKGGIIMARQTTNIAAIARGEKRNVPFGEYNWRVLDVQDGRALLITEDVIDKRPYNTERAAVTWEISALRQYLNGEFYNKFDEQEQAIILEVNNVNANNPRFTGVSKADEARQRLNEKFSAMTGRQKPEGDLDVSDPTFPAKGGNNTADKVFLLSIDEVLKYFGDSGQMTEIMNPEAAPFINDEFNVERLANYEDKACVWWLRSPGSNSARVARVSAIGMIDMAGCPANLTDCGIRPALWLNLNS